MTANLCIHVAGGLEWSITDVRKIIIVKFVLAQPIVPTLWQQVKFVFVGACLVIALRDLCDVLWGPGFTLHVGKPLCLLAKAATPKGEGVSGQTRGNYCSSSLVPKIERECITGRIT